MILDALWDTHQATYNATLEGLLGGCRTDPTSAAGCSRWSVTSCASRWPPPPRRSPPRAARPGFREDVEFALAAIRGLALLRAANGGSPAGAQGHWAPVRERLLRALA